MRRTNEKVAAVWLASILMILLCGCGSGSDKIKSKSKSRGWGAFDWRKLRRTKPRRAEQ